MCSFYQSVIHWQSLLTSRVQMVKILDILVHYRVYTQQNKMKYIEMASDEVRINTLLHDLCRYLPAPPPNHRSEGSQFHSQKIALHKFQQKDIYKVIFTTSTFNIRWALLNIQVDQMFQVRTVVHQVHSSPVNGTHGTRGSKKKLTQKRTKRFVLLTLRCHTLATSLTSRVARCCKLGLLCPLYMLCTEQSQTKWEMLHFPHREHSGLELCISFFWEPGHKHNVVN